VNGNFLDLCILEWTKLFADQRGKHHWQKVVGDRTRFETELLAALRLTRAELDAYKQHVLRYRDKFVAHLDHEPIMQIPRLRLARRSVAFLYNYLLAHEDEGGFFPEQPRSARDYYLLHVNLGRAAYVDQLE
jgi:hypothetical protein